MSVRWFERLGAELAACFLTRKGFSAYLRKRGLEVNQRLRIVRTSAGKTHEQ